MMCAFTGPPKIVRLHGTGTVSLPGDAGFAALRARFGKQRDLGRRSIVVTDVERIADSCGWSVPEMEYVADRDVLDVAHERRETAYFQQYTVQRNAHSIDQLPGLSSG